MGEGGRGRSGTAQIKTISQHVDELMTSCSSSGGCYMPLVCLPLCLVLGLLRKEGGKQLGPALGAPMCQQGVRETVVQSLPHGCHE